MRLLRDLATTIVTGIGVACGLSVINAWGWPVLGSSVRWGIVAVGLVSLFACSSSGWATEEPRTWYRDPWIVAGIITGTAVLVVGVLGLIWASMTYLVLMVAGTVLLWAMSTLHHVAQATGAGRRVTIA